MNKRGIEFSFTWLFAIIVGIFILFAAIYAATQFIRSGTHGAQTQAAKEISIIFNPLETGMASGKAARLTLNAETRIYNQCTLEGSFGSQKFSLSQKSGFLNTWPPAGGAITLYNKYVFSDEQEQGSEFYFFSKPFNMPFKVSELIFMSAKKYCFENTPSFIEDEVKGLDLQNVNFEGNCSTTDVTVCFESGDCDIIVRGECYSGLCDSEAGEYQFGTTLKDGKTLYYTGSLIYGTIFSEPNIYQCNLKRLMMKISQIAYLYKAEVEFLASRGCGTSIGLNLDQMTMAANSAVNSTTNSAILNLNDAANKLDSQNSAQGGCKIYE